jgi:hypothetical protein
VKTSRKFTSERSAKDFAKRTNGILRDLRKDPCSKSNFKVVFDNRIKTNKQDYDPSYFDSPINMNGMNWHTADDL